MREMFKIGDHEFALFLSADRDGFLVHFAEETFHVQLDGMRRILIDREPHDLVWATLGDRTFVHVNGITHEIEYVPPISRYAENAARSKSDHLLAPMPGTVIACAVKNGDMVDVGDLLIVIESMKLETPFKAWRAGRIAAVHVVLGQNFERDRILLSMEAA